MSKYDDEPVILVTGNLGKSKYITTLRKIEESGYYSISFEWLLKKLKKKKADDEPIDLLQIYQAVGLDDALRCITALPEEQQKLAHTLACDFSEHVIPLASKKEIKPCQEAIAMKRLWTCGKITDADLYEARMKFEAAVLFSKDFRKNSEVVTAVAKALSCNISTNAAYASQHARMAAKPSFIEDEWQQRHFVSVLTGRKIRPSKFGQGKNKPKLMVDLTDQKEVENLSSVFFKIFQSHGDPSVSWGVERFNKYVGKRIAKSVSKRK